MTSAAIKKMIFNFYLKFFKINGHMFFCILVIVIIVIVHCLVLVDCVD